MQLEFPKRRSKFLQPCVEALVARGGPIRVGDALTVDLGTKGFAGKYSIDIDPTSPRSFESDYESDDATWFPARIRAAAQALFKTENYGRFVIEHVGGELQFRKTASV